MSVIDGKVANVELLFTDMLAARSGVFVYPLAQDLLPQLGYTNEKDVNDLDDPDFRKRCFFEIPEAFKNPRASNVDPGLITYEIEGLPTMRYQQRVDNIYSGKFFIDASGDADGIHLNLDYDITDALGSQATIHFEFTLCGVKTAGVHGCPEIT